jgi:hypothetical protein
MQDDLDAFEGKITLREENVSAGRTGASIQPESKNYAPIGGNEGKIAGQPADTSPFLNSAPSQIKETQKEDISFLSPQNNSGAKEPFGVQNRSNLPWEEKTRMNQPKDGKRFNWSKILIITLSIMIFVALGFGGYYFWTTGQQTEPQVIDQPQETEEPAPIEITEEKFSADKPNFLIIDSESAAPDKVSDLLKQKAAEIKDSGTIRPIEFIVTDPNNNPMAFHIFAANAGLRLSSSTLSNLDEKFSLYYFNDQGSVRLGLAVEIKNKSNLALELSKEEKTLVDDINLLFLGNPISESEKIKNFNAGSHNNISIRYLNLDSAQTIAVDYALTEKQLIIGTSKNNMRAILDKVGQDLTVD